MLGSLLVAIVASVLVEAPCLSTFKAPCSLMLARLACGSSLRGGCRAVFVVVQALGIGLLACRRQGSNKTCKAEVWEVTATLRTSLMVFLVLLLKVLLLLLLVVLPFLQVCCCLPRRQPVLRGDDLTAGCDSCSWEEDCPSFSFFGLLGSYCDVQATENENVRFVREKTKGVAFSRVACCVC